MTAAETRANGRLDARRQPGQDRSRARVEQILEAAMDLIGRRGADNVTISNIAEQAEMSGASVYRYFPSKQAIIRRLAVDHYARTRTNLENGLQGADENIKEVLLEGLRSYINLHQLDPYPAQLRAAVQADPDLAPLDLQDTRDNADLVASVLRQQLDLADDRTLERRLILVFELLDGVIYLATRIPPIEAKAIVDDFISIADGHIFGGL
ncbi:MAG: TetR/AcrR family transcriptional regulator [Actinomycetota bacterium]